MADTSKIRAKLAKLDTSLAHLESALGPLFAQSLPETLLALDTIQQAKLQTIIPYVVYDLVFVYLKSRGIDPKTHRVIAELERVRQYFDKIKRAEESVQKRKTGIDKAAAGRFIKHAIAQAKNAQLVDEPPDAPPVASTGTNPEHVPVNITSKMIARAEYEKELKESESEEEEDLEVFDEEMAIDNEDAMDAKDGPPEGVRFTALEKGKGRESEKEQSRDGEVAPPRRKRPRMDPFAGYESMSVSEHDSKLPVQTADTSSREESVPTSEDREAKKGAKKKKAKKAMKL